MRLLGVWRRYVTRLRRVRRRVGRGFESLETRTVLANPTVSSIVPDPSQPGANVDNPRFVVTFSETVTGVDAVDFVAAPGPGVFVAPGPLGVTGSGTTYTVTVNGVSGVGTLGLNLVDNNSIRDGGGNGLVGNGSGIFQAAQNFDTGSGPGSVSVGDLNGDGRLDLAVANANFSSNTVSVLLGNGNGTFQAAQNFTTGDRPRSVSMGDVNGDGLLDLAVADSNANSVSVLLGNGNGTFQARQTFATGSKPVSVLVEDVNGDGRLDLAVANASGRTVSVLLGNGNGTFQAERSFATGLGPYSVAVGDLNGDGRLDLAVANYFSNTVSVLLNAANGNFTGQTRAVDTVAPTVASILRQDPLAASTGADQLTFRVTFGEAVQNVSVGDFALGGTSAGDGVVNSVTPVSTSVYDVLITGVTNSNGTIQLLFAAGQNITDLATNALTNSTPTTTETYTLVNNRAPALDNTGNVFAVLGAGARQSAEMRQGTLVSDLLARGAGGNPISDPDAGAARGIALTAVDQSLGNFQYTLVTNNPAESDWVNVDAAGALSDASALLLPTTARIRFTTGRIPHHASAPPFLALESKLDAGITFRAWDQTSGAAGGRGNAGVNGGATAFSTATETSKVYFEVRLFRHFNANASLNVYTLEAEFNALAAANNPAFEDRSTDAWTGFTVLLSNVPELATTAMYRMYYGVQFNANGTQIDMGYRYLTTNLIEAQALENSGPADRRPQRAGAYFREEGVNNGTGILGYIYTTQQPGTQQMRQIYRTDIVQKPTRPPGTSEGGTPTSFTPQENGDHVYTTNTAFETTKTGTWRVEDPRGFVRPLGGSGIIAPATSAGAIATPVARAASVITVGPSIDLFHAGVAGAAFTAILPTTLATTVAVLNPDHVSTTVDLGLIAPPAPAVQPQTVNDQSNTETTETAPTITGELTEETSAADDLFTSLGTTANDLCPW